MQSWNLASKAVRVEGCGSVEGGRRKGSGMGDGALSGGGVLTVPRRSGMPLGAMTRVRWLAWDRT